MDVLRARAFVFLALGRIVAGESAMEASLFTDALGPFGGGKFRQGDGVHIHGIRVVQGVDEYEAKGSPPPFRARIRIFCAWNIFACLIQAVTVVGMVAMERIMVASCGLTRARTGR